MKPVSKPSPSQKRSPPSVTGTFYCVARESHLLYQAFEIDVRDGVVTAVRCLSRAPDLAASSVGHCARGLWVNARTQGKLEATHD